MRLGSGAALPRLPVTSLRLRASGSRLTPNALGELSGKLEKAQEGLRSAVELGLDKLRTDNAEKLEQMRSTVDEKLQVTF